MGPIERTHKGDSHVHIRMSDVGRHRMASIILYFNASEKQVIPPQIIFPLAPDYDDKMIDPTKPYSQQVSDERRRYHPLVKVLYQSNAWSDSATAEASLQLFARDAGEGEKICSSIACTDIGLQSTRHKQHVPTQRSFTPRKLYGSLRRQ